MAEVLLAQTPFKQDSEGFKLVLGEVSSIHDFQGNTQLLRADTPGLLHCLALRKFWISWADLQLRFGKRRVNSNALLEYSSPSPLSVVALTVQTPAPSLGGEWQFNKYMG